VFARESPADVFAGTGSEMTHTGNTRLQMLAAGTTTPQSQLYDPAVHLEVALLPDSREHRSSHLPRRRRPKTATYAFPQAWTVTCPSP
jgi:hypothetical protein